jgi:hypothetical protein
LKTLVLAKNPDRVDRPGFFVSAPPLMESRMPRLAPLLLAALLASIVAGCQSRAERLVAENLYHLEKVVSILERTQGNMEACLAELEKYRVENAERIEEIRGISRDLLRGMAPDERAEFSRYSHERTDPLRGKVQTLAGRFPDPPRINLKIRDIL